MLDLAIGGYSKEDVINQLHAKNGVREIKFRYDLLNKNEMKVGELSATPSGNQITFDSLAEIKRVAKFNFKETELIDIDWLNNKIQPVYCLRMLDGKYIEWALGVFLLSSPARKENNGIWREIEAYDASLILREDKFTDRHRIVAGTRYIDAITTIINSAGISRVNITDSAALVTVDKEFEIGTTTKMEVVNQLLNEINYTSIWADENGQFIANPYILPNIREVDYTYKNDKLSIIHNGAINELDIFNIPNKFIVTASNPEKLPLTSIYVNDSLSSKLSTVNRDRTIVDYRQVDDILDQATLNAYAQRIAYNSSQVYEKMIFSTAIMPHHSFLDTLFIEYSDLNISSKFSETNWSMTLVSGGTMEHSARRIIKI